jgi:adenylosuccinate lyase
VEGLVVSPEGMRRNYDRTGELCFSEGVLLALVEKGRPRQDAYVLVQRAAMKTLAGDGTFQENLAADPEVGALLSPAELARCFDLSHALRHAGTIVDRALALP